MDTQSKAWEKCIVSAFRLAAQSIHLRCPLCGSPNEKTLPVVSLHRKPLARRLMNRVYIWAVPILGRRLCKLLCHVPSISPCLFSLLPFSTQDLSGINKFCPSSTLSLWRRFRGKDFALDYKELCSWGQTLRFSASTFHSNWKVQSNLNLAYTAWLDYDAGVRHLVKTAITPESSTCMHTSTLVESSVLGLWSALVG